MSVLHPRGLTLQKYRNGDLDRGRLARIRLHLKACPVCAAKVEMLSTVDRKLSALSADEPSSGFTERVLAGLEAPSIRHASADSGTTASAAAMPFPTNVPTHGGSSSASLASGSDSGKGSEAPRRIFGFRPVLAHAIVATTGTYLFASSGIVNVVVSIERGAVEYSLLAGIHMVMYWVDQLSHAWY